MENLIIKSLGLVPYHKSWKLMKEFTIKRKTDVQDEVWLLEHTPIFTLGYNGDTSHLIKPSSIPITKSDRGGNITYHAPGQLVGYLLVDLKRKNLRIHDLVRTTENLIINTLKDYSIQSHTIKKAPGVYVEGAKICSLGFRIKNGCSYHGFALNINMDLEPFSYINPCGLEGIKITQIKFFVQNIDIENVQNKIILNLEQDFGYTNIDIKKYNT